jgi:hypothetical protein
LLLDNIVDVTNLPIYDQYNERNQFTYHSYKEEVTETIEGNYLPLFFSSFELLKENAKVIIETKESMLMPNHTDSLRQFDKKLQPLVKEESKKECVQQPKEMERCSHDRSI